MALPHSAMGFQQLVIVVFSDHTHLLFLLMCPDTSFTSAGTQSPGSINLTFRFLSISHGTLSSSTCKRGVTTTTTMMMTMMVVMMRTTTMAMIMMMMIMMMIEYVVVW